MYGHNRCDHSTDPSIQVGGRQRTGVSPGWTTINFWLKSPQDGGWTVICSKIFRCFFGEDIQVGRAEGIDWHLLWPKASGGQ